MGFHFTMRFYHLRRNSPSSNLLFKPPVTISPFSTFAAENQSHLLPHIFQQCTKRKASEPGRQAHARMIVSGFKPTIYIANYLLQMYVKCLRLEYAAKVFDRMPERDFSSWTAMMSGYLVNGKMQLAQLVFDMMPERNVITWTSLISGYLQNGNCLKSIEVFVMMGREAVTYNETTFSIVLKAISSLEGYVLGRQVHGNVVKLGFECEVMIGTALLSMYAKCNMLDEAQRIFDAMQMKDFVTWSAIIAGCVQNDEFEGGLELYKEMQRESVRVSEHVYASVFKACAGLRDSRLASQLHSNALKNDVGANIVVGTSILDMYAKCDDLDNAGKVFNLLPTHNMESYTALLAGHGRGDHGSKGIQLFLMLLKSGLGFDEISLSVAVSACAVSTGLLTGTQIHGLAIKTPFYDNIAVATAILNMYGKCGALAEACCIFDEMKSKDVVSWNAMVCAYAHHGHGNEALQLFEKMVLREKVMPNHTTFVGVLHACAHSGLVDEALNYLCKMQKDYGLSPELEHYSCAVDALGRSGRISDAIKLIEDMPLKATSDVWRSVLSNCKMHGNVEVAEIAARSLVQLDPRDSTTYVLLSQVYKDAGMWDEASKIIRVMESSGLKKDEAGCSWIEA